jgi:hypothetical protein
MPFQHVPPTNHHHHPTLHQAQRVLRVRVIHEAKALEPAARDR